MRVQISFFLKNEMCYLNNHLVDNLWTTTYLQKIVDINKKTKAIKK